MFRAKLHRIKKDDSEAEAEAEPEAAIYAGYKKSRVRYTGYRLATYGYIKERIKELNEARDLATNRHILSRILELLGGGREASPLMPIYIEPCYIGGTYRRWWEISGESS